MAESLAARAVLFAEADFLRMLSLRFKASSGKWDGTDAVLGLVLALVVALVGWLIARQMRLQRELDVFNPRKLFDELCRVHQLPREAVATLHAMAQDRGLDMPGALFVHPEYFTPAAHRRDDAEYVAAVAQLKARLFGEAATDDVRPLQRVDTPHESRAGEE